MSSKALGILVALSAAGWIGVGTAADAQTANLAPPPAHGFSVVYRFNDDGTGRDGVFPTGGVLALPDGSLIGTTQAGGKFGNHDWGVIYKVAPDGVETVLHDFDDVDDGWSSQGRPILASDGRVYGVMGTGGTGTGGLVWRMDPDGANFTVVRAFDRDGPGKPSWGLLEGKDGNFYGLGLSSARYKRGTIWRMTPSGELTVAHAFRKDRRTGSSDGSLVQASNGDIYGVSAIGGANGVGTFYVLRPDGTFAVLHDFDSATGISPSGALAEDADGFIYGVTGAGGSGGNGTIYRMDPATGHMDMLHAFAADGSEGTYAQGLMRTPDGNFYGASTYGGEGQLNGWGTVYRVSPAGELTLLHVFDTVKAGYHPLIDALARGPDGFLYGTCVDGGRTKGQYKDNGMGTVFRIAP